MYLPEPVRRIVRFVLGRSSSSGAGSEPSAAMSTELEPQTAASAASLKVEASGARSLAIGGAVENSTLVVADTAYISQGADPENIRHLIQVTGETHELLAQVSERLLRTGVAFPEQGERTRWTDRLDLVKHFINSGRVTVALGVLENLRDEMSSDTAAADLARLHSYFGICYLRQERLPDARRHLQNAVELRPDEPVHLVNLATALFAERDSSGALNVARRAIAAQPDLASAWAVALQAGVEVGEEIVVPEALREAPEILAVKAFIALQRSDWDQGIVALERSIQLSTPPDPEHMLMAVQARMSRADSVSGGASVRDLDAAAEMLAHLIPLVQEPDQQNLLQRALLLRGGLRRERGEEEGAIEDFRAAIRVNPGGYRAVFALAHQYVRSGRAEAALLLLEDHAAFNPRPELLALKASALAALHRSPEEVGAAIASVFSAKDPPDDPVQIRLMCAETALEAQMGEDAAEIMSGVPIDVEDWYAGLLRARIAALLGDTAAADAGYMKAIEGAKPSDVSAVREEYGFYLQRQGAAEAALAQLQLAGAERGEESTRRRYARLLYKAGDYTRLSEVVQQASEDGIRSPWLLELKGWLEHARGDLVAEVATLTLWREQDPENPEVHLALAYALLRAGDRDGAAKALDVMDGLAALTSRNIMGRAQLEDHAGRKTLAMDLALLALRHDPASEELQAAFVTIFFHRDKGTLRSPGVVEPNTHVVLEGPGGNRVEYTIYADGPADPLRGEFLASSPVVAPILGLRKGETFARRAGEPLEAIYTVAEIKPALVEVFQRTLRDFDELHPESRAIQAIHVGENPTLESFAPVLAAVFEAGYSSERAIAAYEEHGMPLGMPAAALGKRLPDVYAYLAGTTGKLLHTEFADAFGEAVKEASGDTIVLTRSGLVTAEELGIMPFLTEHFRRVVVPQSLVDDLRNDFEELENSPGEQRGTMAAVDGRLVMVENEPGSANNAKRVRRAQLAWVREFCVVEPLDPQFLEGRFARWRKWIGNESYDAYVLAVTLNLPLYADDLGLRRLDSENLGQARGFSTAALLVAANRSGSLSAEELHRHLRHLIGLHHVHVPVTAELLRETLIASGFELNGDVLEVFGRLNPRFMAPNEAVATVVELLRQVALSPAAPWLDSVVNVALLSLWDDNPQTVRMLHALVKAQFRLLPLAQQRIEHCIDNFLRARIDAGGVTELP